MFTTHSAVVRSVLQRVPSEQADNALPVLIDALLGSGEYTPKQVAGIDAERRAFELKFRAALLIFAARLETFLLEHKARTYPGNTPDRIVIDPNGRKYVRIIREDLPRPHVCEGELRADASCPRCYVSRSVYCFIDTTNGNILKPASWKAPAKYARGSIFGANPLDGCGPYGVAYRR